MFAVSHDIVNRNEYLIMIGNPGVGKSTILNALVGSATFRAGINPQTGLTTCLQLVEEPPGSKKFYGDTPGLVDMQKREEAAREIATALRQDGRYKLVFVVMEESLRVRPQDVATINIVLDAIKLEKGEIDVPYGIIVNKITEKRLARLYEDNELMKLFQDSLNQKHHTRDFHFYLHNEALEDEDDALHEPTAELLRFLDDLHFLDIKPNQVADITTETFDQVEQAVDEQIAILAHELQDMQARRAEAVKEKRYTQRDVCFQIKRDLRPIDMVEDRLRLTGQVERVFETTLEKVFGPLDEGKPLKLLITIKIVSNGAGMLSQVIKIITGRRRSYPMLEIEYRLESNTGTLVDRKAFQIHPVAGVNDEIVMKMAKEMSSDIANDVCDKMKWF